jgi:hypothetical protein
MNGFWRIQFTENTQPITFSVNEIASLNHGGSVFSITITGSEMTDATSSTDFIIPWSSNLVTVDKPVGNYQTTLAAGDSNAFDLTGISNGLTINLEKGTLASGSTNWKVVNAVPGPLPILGLVAVFGYNRKLRKRFKSSKPEVISTTAF